MLSFPVASIDITALKHNFALVKKWAPQASIMSVIKANAYGHGLVPVARALSNSDAFAIARVTEGLALRQAGIKQPIVVLGGVFSASDFRICADYTLSIAFCHFSHINLMVTTKLSKPLEFCWLMIETGMHRLGLSVSDVDNALHVLTQSANVAGGIGLMTHFANADCVSDSRNQSQLDSILNLTSRYGTKVSAANSAAILSMKDSHGDWVRPGLMLYGISPFRDQSAAQLGLKPVMTLMSTIISMQTLAAGDEVGYGGEWVAPKTTRVATVNIGYGDGYIRQLSNKGLVFVNNRVVPVLGRVSMDLICIDVSLVEDISIGDTVYLWGNDPLTISQQAKLAHTIPYELICQVSERVARKYHYG